MKIDWNLINIVIALIRLGIEFVKLYRDFHRRR